MTSFTINNKKIAHNHAPYIIAEMACAHDGDYQKALRIIDAAVEAKADAIQLQFFTPDTTVTPRHPVYNTLRDIAFSYDQWQQMVDYIRKQSAIDVWVCTYDYPSVSWAHEMNADGIKINSSDLSNPELLKAVAQTGIPFTIGTGASYLEEVRSCIELVENNGAEHFVLMHGVQNFPTELEDVQINRLDILQSAFPDYLTGYADHTNADFQESLWIDAAAVGKGAAVLEKHITWDRSEKGIDHQAALNPDEFITYVQNVKNTFKALGKKALQPLKESDFKYREFQKKSIVVNKNLDAGSLLDHSNTSFLRNDKPGLSPSYFSKIEGRKVKSSLKKFDNIFLENLE